MKPLRLAALLSLLALPAAAGETAVGVELLARGGADVLGRALAYPAGTPDVTVAIVTVPPGAATAWHRHDVPLVAHVLEGTLTVDYGSRGSRDYGPGAVVFEAMDWPHRGQNAGSETVRLLAVYIGAQGLANSTEEPGPR